MAEWFENTPRRKLTAQERTTVFMKANGFCALCSMTISPGQDWDVEHPTPLWASGSDDGADLAPVHRRCHQAKTRREASQRAKQNRVRWKHIGAWQSRSPMACGRNSRLKKRLDGSVVDRATGKVITLSREAWRRLSGRPGDTRSRDVL
jgi:5-methylcytosine-specific restriction protein A